MTDRLKIKIVKPASGVTMGKVYEVLEEARTDVIIRADDNRLITVSKAFAKVVDTTEQRDKPRSKYHIILKGVEFDIYDLIAAYKITNPALQHLFKKVAMCGQRGHKNAETDLQDIIDSAVRAKELEG